jgi:asparagine synthase (glutamine-hydrolysing)
MCGIAGWFDSRNDKEANKAVIQAMSDAIRHRGPDGEGFHFEPGLAFAHRRLAIIDLNTGQQPMSSLDGRIVITFNGEIYNYRELQERLRRAGHQFRTRSDTEVVIEAWRAWGPGCVDQLQGMFAFALWDRQEQTLFMARDRLGEKPLYYAQVGESELIFGSELKALNQYPEFRRAIDPCAVQDFFSLGYIADPKTIYRDARKLEAGHCFQWQRGRQPVVRRYWDAVPMDVGELSLESATEELRERLKSCVRSQLVADVPVGSFLSGGTDSSGVTALAASQVSEALNTFTIGFDDPRFDERQYARDVATRYGVRQFSEIVAGDDFETVRILAQVFDEPFGDSSAMPTYRLARLASRTVKVALSGDGGDELFAGYRRYLFHNREEALRGMLPLAARRVVFGSLGRVYPQLDWLPRPLRARQTFRELSVDAAEGYFHNVSILNDESCAQLFSASFRHEVGDYRACDVIAHHMGNAPSRDPVTLAQYVDIKTWLAGDILTKVDRTAMACGLEVRVPMLDGEFVRWSLGLPLRLRLKGKEGKYLLKRALEPLLPRDVLYRQKQGFSVPLARWFRGELGEEFSRQVTADGLLGEFVDIGHVRTLLDRHKSGWADNSRALWLVWIFQGFLAAHQGARSGVTGQPAPALLTA